MKYDVLPNFCFITVFLFLKNVSSFVQFKLKKMSTLEKISMSNDDLSAFSSSLFSKIQSNVALKETDFTSVKDMSKFNFKDLSGNEYSGSSSWYDETTGSKLTGIAKYEIIAASDSKFGIDGWLGPGLAIPHMILNFGISGDKYWIETDYIPRGPFPFGSDPSYLDL